MRRLNQGTSAGKPNEMVRFTKTLLSAEERVATSNVDTGCVEEKVFLECVY